MNIVTVGYLFGIDIFTLYMKPDIINNDLDFDAYVEKALSRLQENYRVEGPE